MPVALFPSVLFIVVELIISLSSSLRGEQLRWIDLAGDPGVNVIAVKRSNLHMTERNNHDVRLQTSLVQFT
ncbi:MAG: hypothetical protein V2B20_19885 [Pseudomonadota bacterium]